MLLSMVWSFLVLWVASCLWCGRAEERHSAGGARGVGRRRERAVVISVCVHALRVEDYLYSRKV